MAQFELILSIAKRNKDNELYTEEREYMCFCKNPDDMDEITKKANEIVYEEFEENMKDEVLFGSADVVINETTVLIINYQNKFLPEDEVNTIMDLLIEGSGQETVH